MSDPYPIFHKNVESEMIARIKELEMPIRVKVIAIHHHFKRKLQLDRELHRKMIALLRENEAKKIEYNQKENEIISGKRNPEGVELTFFNDDSKRFLSDRDKRIHQSYIDRKNPNRVTLKPTPFTEHYWLKVFRSVPALSPYQIDRERDKFQQLERVEWARDDPKNANNFSITFRFNQENNFVRGNGVMRKRFIMYNTAMPLSSEVQAEFKQDINAESLLNFFQHPINLEEAIDKEPQDRKEMERKMGEHYELALLFTQEVIPYSLEYYLGLRSIMDEQRQQDQNQEQGTSDQSEDSDDDKKNKNSKPRQKKNNYSNIDNYQNLECSTY